MKATQREIDLQPTQFGTVTAFREYPVAPRLFLWPVAGGNARPRQVEDLPRHGFRYWRREVVQHLAFSANGAQDELIVVPKHALMPVGINWASSLCDHVFGLGGRKQGV